MQSGARCPSESEVAAECCLERRTVVFPGASMLGLLDLNFMLLTYCLDKFTGVPPASQDLWLSRALIVSRSWNFVEPDPDFPAFSPGGSPGTGGRLFIPRVVRYFDDTTIVLAARRFDGM